MTPLALDPRLGIAAVSGMPATRPTTTTAEKARAQAQDFEAVFLGTMFQHMFTEIGSEGPLGGGTGVGVWRSFLTDEYAKSFAKSGGIGLSDQIYRSLMGQQDVAAKQIDAVAESKGPKR